MGGSMYVRIGAALSAALFAVAVPVLAAEPQPSFQCEIKEGGKTLRVWGSNPTGKEAKCSVRCLFHETNDKTFNLPCNATLEPKAPSKVLCESHDTERAVDFVDGMSTKCS